MSADSYVMCYFKANIQLYFVNGYLEYRKTVHYLETGELLPENTVPEKIEIAKLHLQRLANLKGEAVATKEFRKLAGYYLKGVPRASKTKVAINEAENLQTVEALLDQFVVEHLEREERQKQRLAEI